MGVDNLFPGFYRAACTSDDKVRFLDSGCATDTCASTSLYSEACDRNNGTTIASLYSRLVEPEYIVQNKSIASMNDGYYTCLRLQGPNETSASFVVVGDCSNAACQATNGTTFTIDSGSSTTTPAQSQVAPSSLATSPPQPTHAKSESDATTMDPPKSTPMEAKQQSQSGAGDDQFMVVLAFALAFGIVI